MGIENWSSELEQLGNSLSLAGVVLTAFSLAAAWWFFYAPRQIKISATATAPIFWMDASKLPFTITVTNKNSRQVKVKKVGFETVGRKSASYELTIDSSLFQNAKLLIAEGDTAELPFDGHVIANKLAQGLDSFKLPRDPTILKIWVYITHGRKIQVAVDPNLLERILRKITAAPAAPSAT